MYIPKDLVNSVISSADKDIQAIRDMQKKVNEFAEEIEDMGSKYSITDSTGLSWILEFFVENMFPLDNNYFINESEIGEDNNLLSWFTKNGLTDRNIDTIKAWSDNIFLSQTIPDNNITNKIYLANLQEDYDRYFVDNTGGETVYSGETLAQDVLNIISDWQVNIITALDNMAKIRSEVIASGIKVYKEIPEYEQNSLKYTYMISRKAIDELTSGSPYQSVMNNYVRHIAETKSSVRSFVKAEFETVLDTIASINKRVYSSKQMSKKLQMDDTILAIQAFMNKIKKYMSSHSVVKNIASGVPNYRYKVGQTVQVLSNSKVGTVIGVEKENGTGKQLITVDIRSFPTPKKYYIDNLKKI